MLVSIHQETDPGAVNRILNDPGVRPWIADAAEGPIDVSDKVENPNIVFLMGQFGGVMLMRIMIGIWEVHTFVLPEGRNGWSLEMVRSAQHWLFTKTDAYEVLTRIPRTHPAALGLAIKAGMTPEYHRPDGVKFNGQVVPVDVYKLSIQDWMMKSDQLERRGAEFHEWMNKEADKHGYTDPHEPDPEHNRIVGATIEMFMGGQPVKALMAYNRWAWIARHATISLLEANPPTIAMDIGRLTLAGGELEFTPWKKTMN